LPKNASKWTGSSIARSASISEYATAGRLPPVPAAASRIALTWRCTLATVPDAVRID